MLHCSPSHRTVKRECLWQLHTTFIVPLFQFLPWAIIPVHCMDYFPVPFMGHYPSSFCGLFSSSIHGPLSRFILWTIFQFLLWIIILVDSHGSMDAGFPPVSLCPCSESGWCILGCLIHLNVREKEERAALTWSRLSFYIVVRVSDASCSFQY